MSALTAFFHPSIRFTRTRRSRSATILADYAAGIRDAREMSARYNRLSRMSDSELARFGITRRDVARLSMTGMHGLAASPIDLI